jgi:cation:H+ antiporter
MEALLESHFQAAPLSILFLVVAATLYVVGKGADILVDEAVSLSIRWGIPTTVIGATIVSLGTTTPEAAVSVLAAVKGSPDLALGNAVGSIICDTGLILGTATLISPLPLHRSVVNRQGWIQVGAGFLLVIASLPYASLRTVFSEGGGLPQWIGFAFLGLLVIYIVQSIRWSRTARNGVPVDAGNEVDVDRSRPAIIFIRLLFGIFLVVGSSSVLIPAVKETALRLDVPQSIIAATLVAFGTSLPEFVTAVTAALKRHGELAVGNVIGADILNVLFVSGASAAATGGGLAAPSHFFFLLYPIMLFVLIVFRVGIFFSGDQLKRPFGVILLCTYVIGTILSYVLR